MSTEIAKAQKLLVAQQTRRRSSYWLARGTERALAEIEVSICKGVQVTAFFETDGAESDIYVTDIVDGQGYSLIERNEFWQTVFENDDMQEWLVQQLLAQKTEQELGEAYDRAMDKAAGF